MGHAASGVGKWPQKPRCKGAGQRIPPSASAQALLSQNKSAGPWTRIQGCGWQPQPAICITNEARSGCWTPLASLLLPSGDLRTGVSIPLSHRLPLPQLPERHSWGSLPGGSPACLGPSWPGQPSPPAWKNNNDEANKLSSAKEGSLNGGGLSTDFHSALTAHCAEEGAEAQGG